MKLSSYPHLVKEWHPTKNGELTPDGSEPVKSVSADGTFIRTSSQYSRLNYHCVQRPELVLSHNSINPSSPL